MFMTLHQNAGQNRNRSIANEFFEGMENDIKKSIIHSQRN